MGYLDTAGCWFPMTDSHNTPIGLAATLERNEEFQDKAGDPTNTAIILCTMSAGWATVREMILSKTSLLIDDIDANVIPESSGFQCNRGTLLESRTLNREVPRVPLCWILGKAKVGPKTPEPRLYSDECSQGC